MYDTQEFCKGCVIEGTCRLALQDYLCSNDCPLTAPIRGLVAVLQTKLPGNRQRVIDGAVNGCRAAIVGNCHRSCGSACKNK